MKDEQTKPQIKSKTQYVLLAVGLTDRSHPMRSWIGLCAEGERTKQKIVTQSN